MHELQFISNCHTFGQVLDSLHKIFDKLKKLAGGGITQLLTLISVRLAGALFSIGLTYLITNSFPVAIVGEYEYVRPILLLLSGLTLLGFDRSVLYYAGIYSPQVMTSIYRRMLLAVLISCGVLIFAIHLIPNEYVEWMGDGRDGAVLLYKTIIALVAYAVLMLNITFFRVIDRHKKAEFYLGLIKQLPFAVGVLAILYFNEYLLLPDAFLLGFVPLAITTTWVTVKKVLPSEAEEGPAFISILKQSFPMAVTAIGFWLLFSIDIFLLNIYSTKASIAVYAIPLKFVFLLNFIPSALSAAASKEFSSLYEYGDMKTLRLKVRNYTRMIIFLAAIPIVVLIFFSEEFLGFFGQEYVRGALVLKLTMLGAIINLSCGLNISYFNMTGKQKVLQWLILLALTVNLGLNLWLIPTYDILGAAIAYVAANLVLNITSVIYVYRKENLWLIVH